MRDMKTRKKVLSRVVAAVCVLALLITGSYAWRGISSAINPFNDRKVIDDPGANLHDDFNAETGAKEVYVENTGNEDVYVRIKLSDLFAPGVQTPPAGATYTPYVPATGDLTTAGNHEAEGFEWTFGNAVAYDYTSITASTEWANAADRAATDNLVGDQRGDAQAGSTIVDLTALPKDKTAPAGEVISMATYKTKNPAEKAEFVGWIYDVDGYAYWSQVLPAGGATSLLLNGVTMPTKGDSTYFYGIKVDMEYVDKADLAAWTEGTDIKEGAGAGVGNKAPAGTTDAINSLKEIDARRNDWRKGLTVGDKFEASGWEWLVIAVDGDNVLVITTTIIGSTIFNPDRDVVDTNLYNGSVLDTKLRSFYNELVVADAIEYGQTITSPAQPSNFASAITGYADRDTADGFSKVDVTGEKTFFALSWKESNDYLLSNSAFYLADQPDQAKIPVGFSNTYRDWGFGTNQGYWTRTPGELSFAVSRVHPGGAIFQSAVEHDNIGARPAIWISTK